MGVFYHLISKMKNSPTIGIVIIFNIVNFAPFFIVIRCT